MVHALLFFTRNDEKGVQTEATMYRMSQLHIENIFPTPCCKHFTVGVMIIIIVQPSGGSCFRDMPDPVQIFTSSARAVHNTWL